MIIVDNLADLREKVSAQKKSGQLAFIPTMGNLHQGHLSLVEHGRKIAKGTIVSIFVNPLQFGAGEDLDSYPRTLARDIELLESVGTDILYTPSVSTMYPKPQDQQTIVDVPGLSTELCGASRPGHFAGVTTVVCKLFNMVQPDLAVFGKKDFQQLMLLRQMVDDLAMPIELHGVDIMREPDGLAMSSRNGYLSTEQREQAARIYAVLQQCRDDLLAGDMLESVIKRGQQTLTDNGFVNDYLEIRKVDDLHKPTNGMTDNLVLLVAAYLGTTRLIDNIEVYR